MRPVEIVQAPPMATVTPIRESAMSMPEARADDEPEEEVEVVALADVDSNDFERFSSGIWALDRTLDTGLAYGATILLSGDKGAGKTTLSTRIVMEHVLTSKTHRVFVASAEEPFERFAVRLGRLGYDSAKCQKAFSRIFSSRETDIVRLHDAMEKYKPTLVLYDSLKKFTHPDVDTRSFLTHGPPVTEEITQFAQDTECCSVVISRLTKAGKIAGDENIGYDVDVILNLKRYAPKGRKTPFVELTCEKNRLGSEEVRSWFRKTERGLLCSNGPKKRSGQSKKRSE